MRLTLSLLAAAAGFAAPSGAYAYVRSTTSVGTPIKWPSPCVTLYGSAANPPKRLTSATLTAAVKAAAAAWSRPLITCTDLQIAANLDGPEGTATARDAINRLIFKRDKWCRDASDASVPCYDKTALAVTTVSARTDDGAILDADIEVNAVDYSWDDMSVKGVASGAQDLQNVLTHELGHFIGFDHNCYQGNESAPKDETGTQVVRCNQASTTVRAVVMYPTVDPGDYSHRKLAADDRKAVCTVYPKGTMTPVCLVPDGGVGGGGGGGSDDGGGCTMTPAGRPRAGLPLGLAALGLLATFVRRRRPRG